MECRVQRGRKCPKSEVTPEGSQTELRTGARNPEAVVEIMVRTILNMPKFARV